MPIPRRLPAALLIPLLLSPLPPAHACAPEKAGMVGIMSFYQGTIGPYPVRMGLQFAADGSVVGLYGYAASPGRLALRGQLHHATRLTLRESAAGKATGRIAAIMPGTGDAACQTITGQWVAAAGGAPLPVRLRYSPPRCLVWVGASPRSLLKCFLVRLGAVSSSRPDPPQGAGRSRGQGWPAHSRATAPLRGAQRP